MYVDRVLLIKVQHKPGLSFCGVKIQKVCTSGYFTKNVTKGRGLGVSLNHICTLSVSPTVTFKKIIKKNGTQKCPSCSIPHVLILYTLNNLSDSLIVSCHILFSHLKFQKYDKSLNVTINVSSSFAGKSLLLKVQIGKL